jgi:tetratricopeptide (TPR) repeat protein
LAFFIANAGKTDEAVDWAQQALRLDPKGPDWFRTNLAWAYYHGNRPEEALAELKKLNQPEEFLMAAIYARLGRLDEARATMDGIRKQWPTYTIRDEATFPGGKHPQLKEPLQQAYLDDLRKAGLPE